MEKPRDGLSGQDKTQPQKDPKQLFKTNIIEFVAYYFIVVCTLIGIKSSIKYWTSRGHLESTQKISL